jgi:diacylglycerol kinase family enzyme
MHAARAAARGDILIAAGGDGTVSAVAGVAVKAGVTFGVIPCGTLNHFARDAGIPLDRDKAIAAIAAGFVRRLDVAVVNGRTFVNNASLGLYPRLVWERIAEQKGGRRKWTAFAIGVFRTWRRYRTLTVRMTVDGRDYLRRTPFVFVGNGQYRLTGRQIGERPSLDKGVLSLYVAPEAGRFELIALALRAVAGRITPDVKLEAFLAREATIEPARHRVSIALDGELLVIQPPLRYLIRPGALRTIVAPPE